MSGTKLDSRYPDLGEALGAMGAEASRPDEPGAVQMMAVTAILYVQPSDSTANWKVLYATFPDFEGSKSAMLRAMAKDLLDMADQTGEGEETLSS